MFQNLLFSATLRSPWGAPDGWMLNYTGLMDEFRIYNTLSDNEVVALYKLEKTIDKIRELVCEN
jgi:hypothetical protein